MGRTHVARVGDELAEEDVLVGVQGVDQNVHQARHLRLELKLLRVLAQLEAVGREQAASAGWGRLGEQAARAARGRRLLPPPTRSPALARPAPGGAALHALRAHHGVDRACRGERRREPGEQGCGGRRPRGAGASSPLSPPTSSNATSATTRLQPRAMMAALRARPMQETLANQQANRARVFESNTAYCSTTSHLVCGIRRCTTRHSLLSACCADE